MKKLATVMFLVALVFGLASMAMAGTMLVSSNAPLEARVEPSAADQVAGMNNNQPAEKAGEKVHFSYQPVGFVPEWAKEPSGEKEGEGVSFGFNFTSTVRSGWIGPIGYRSHVGPVIINELFQELPGGFYTYFWNLIGLEKAGSDEIDYFFGWAGEVGGCKIDVGIALWDPRNFMSSDGSNTDYWNFYAELGKEVSLFQDLNVGPKVLVYARAEWVEPVTNTEGNEGGFLGFLGVRPEWELRGFQNLAFPLFLKGDFRIAYDPGLYGGDVALIGRATIQASWQVLDHVSWILPGLDFSQPFTSVNDGRGSEAAIFTGLNFSFNSSEILGIK